MRDIEVDLVLSVGDRGRRGAMGCRDVRGRLGLERLVAGLLWDGGPDGLGVRRQLIGERLKLRLGLGDDRLDVRRLGLALGEFLVRGDAAVA